MDGFLYIPYVNTDLDDSSFNYTGPAFDYLAQLGNVGNNIVGAEYYANHKPTNKTIGYNAGKVNGYYSDQISFYELPCKFYDADGNIANIEYLLDFYKTKESFMLIFSFDHDNNDEECLIELKSWVSESKKIMSMPQDVYSEEMKIGLLPRRQFKLRTGKANAFLEECIFFDNYEDKIVIFVKEIIFFN